MLELDSWGTGCDTTYSARRPVAISASQPGPQANAPVDVARTTRNASESFMVCTFELVLI
jgi:hypothetical protein